MSEYDEFLVEDYTFDRSFGIDGTIGTHTTLVLSSFDDVALRLHEYLVQTEGRALRIVGVNDKDEEHQP